MKEAHWDGRKKIKISIEKEEQIMHKRRKCRWLISVWKSSCSSLKSNQNKVLFFCIKPAIIKKQMRILNNAWLGLIKCSVIYLTHYSFSERNLATQGKISHFSLCLDRHGLVFKEFHDKEIHFKIIYILVILNRPLHIILFCGFRDTFWWLF